MFLLLFIFILSVRLSLSVSFSLHFFVIPLCVRISQPAQTALARRLLSLSPLSLRCPCVKCQTLLSGQRRRHLPYRRRQFPASPPPPTLHTPLSTLSTFREVYLRWRQSVSSPGVAPCSLSLPLPSLLPHYLTLLRFLFVLHYLLPLPALPRPALR